MLVGVFSLSCENYFLLLKLKLMPKKTYSRPKYKNFICFPFLILVFFFLAIIAYLFYQNFELREKIKQLSAPLTYTNARYQYTFKYPATCSHGPLPAGCKANPPAERPQECLCFLNGEDADYVLLQSYVGAAEDPILATMSIDYYQDLPAGTDLITWLKANFPDSDIPDEPNTQIAGLDAVKIYSPASPQAFSAENIYFVKENHIFKIQLIDVDQAVIRSLYDGILETFEFNQ